MFSVGAVGQPPVEGLLGAGTVGSVVDQPKVLGGDPGPSELLVVGVEPEQRGAETTSILQSVVVKLSGPGRDHRPGEQVVIDTERRFPRSLGCIAHSRSGKLRFSIYLSRMVAFPSRPRYCCPARNPAFLHQIPERHHGYNPR
jgi:hypothetical protein